MHTLLLFTWLRFNVRVSTTSVLVLHSGHFIDFFPFFHKLIGYSEGVSMGEVDVFIPSQQS
jgi:hypothetical protein